MNARPITAMFTWGSGGSISIGVGMSDSKSSRGMVTSSRMFISTSPN